MVGIACLCLILGYLLKTLLSSAHLKNVQTKAEEMVKNAQREVEESNKKAEIEIKKELARRKDQLEKEFSRRQIELEKLESKLSNRERNIEKRIDFLDKREKTFIERERVLSSKIQSYDEKLKNLEKLRNDAKKRLEEVSGMTTEEAKKVLMESLENEVKQDASASIRRVENETRELAAKKARQIITLAIQKCATDQVTESTVSVVNLPNEEMKGRIIGREGRNIRALELATGVNIVIDDTPEAVVLSCFDPLRREVARLTLENLIGDGRIHPARIEEIVKKVEKELEDHIYEVGERSAFDVNVHELHPETIKLLGRLKYRTSFGQNVLLHSEEVAYLAGVMAGELGVDVNLAKRAGLLHDIGKAVDYEMEGTHAKIGADLARKFNESPAIVHAIAAHHGDEEPKTIIAVLVQAADAISAARPGARRETLETYIKRLEKLEEIADSFSGVEKAYAIQAGREIRIMVEPTQMTDNECALLAREVTKKIERELEYPGQIKVTVIRQTRAVEYAK